MESRVWIVVAAVIAGILVGAVAMQAIGPPVTGTSVPSHGLTTATGCAAADDPRAWIGVVPSSDHVAVYLANYSVPHGTPDVEVRGELTRAGANAWVLAVTVSPGTAEKQVPDTCQPRSIISAAVALPPGAESLRITVGGEEVIVVDTAVEAPRFAYLDA